jgi:hypothetical protein
MMFSRRKIYALAILFLLTFSLHLLLKTEETKDVEIDLENDLDQEELPHTINQVCD